VARVSQELSPVRPITSLFHPAISLSIAGQLAIHLYCMVSAISMAKEYSTAEEIEEAMGLNADAGAPPPTPDAAAAHAEGATALLTPFKPSLLNTVVFLIETAQQVRARLCAALPVTDWQPRRLSLARPLQTARGRVMTGGYTSGRVRSV
jgi:hypothetical protein